MAMDDRVPFVVSGNHMRGLSKAHELEALGACLLGERLAASDYRFYVLATDPPKPALVRSHEAMPASAVIVEEWSIPRTALAELALAVVPPQGIGRVRLGDGRLVHGFIVEPGALAGATDITHLGSWRSYLQRR